MTRISRNDIALRYLLLASIFTAGLFQIWPHYLFLERLFSEERVIGCYRGRFDTSTSRYRHAIYASIFAMITRKLPYYWEAHALITIVQELTATLSILWVSVVVILHFRYWRWDDDISLILLGIPPILGMPPLYFELHGSLLRSSPIS